MNQVCLVGRVCKEIELRQTQSNMHVTEFALAVNRRKKGDGADFITCVAWNKTAELMAQYVRKGDRIGITGHIQTGRYENKDHINIYTTKVIVDNMEFLESRRADAENAPADAPPPSGPNDFTEVEDDELPF